MSLTIKEIDMLLVTIGIAVDGRVIRGEEWDSLYEKLEHMKYAPPPPEKTLSYEVGEKSICRMCNTSIQFTGTYWNHIGLPEAVQPRHPAIPTGKARTTDIHSRYLNDPVFHSLVTSIKKSIRLEDYTLRDFLDAITLIVERMEDARQQNMR